MFWHNNVFRINTKWQNICLFFCFHFCSVYCIQQLTQLVLCCLLKRLHWITALSNTMNAEIQHWETSPALDWNVYHSGFCINCHSQKENQEQPRRCYWEVTLSIDVTKKHFKRLQNSIWNTNTDYGATSLSIFWLLHTSAKKQACPLIPSSVLTAWSMENKYTKTLRFVLLKVVI